MSVRSAQSITKVFTTRRFDTGAATNADSTPTGTLYVNGTANGATVTVTNITTGIYKAAVTLPTLTLNDVVDLRINATVNSVTDNSVIWSETKDFFAGSIPDVVAGAAGGIFIAGTNAATTVTTAFTTTFTGNLTGSVGSVTGAVGSVTGNVGGSVASVVGLTAANLDAAVSTRLASASYTAPDNASISAIGIITTAIKAKTDQLTFTVALHVDATATATIAASDIRDAIGMAAADLDTQLDAILASGAGGAGSVSYTVTITDNVSAPLDGAGVWVTTDEAGTNVVAGTLYTNASGIATFLLDPGTYYLWCQHSGYNGTNPTVVTVSA